jgi:hypothetical protein
MNAKTIITTLLLLFVTASVAYLVVGKLGEKSDRVSAPYVEPAPPDPSPTDLSGNAPDSGTTTPRVASPSKTPAAALPASDPGPATGSPETYVNVYYFHGYNRCITCRTMELYTREAVNDAFLKELGDGSLHLSVLNMQDPVNETYVEDFQLKYYMVVIERIVDGKRREWKKLEGIWDLVKDKEGFKKYIQEETRAYLKGIG